jgi:hypothetical protein
MSSRRRHRYCVARRRWRVDHQRVMVAGHSYAHICGAGGLIGGYLARL